MKARSPGHGTSGHDWHRAFEFARSLEGDVEGEFIILSSNSIQWASATYSPDRKQILIVKMYDEDVFDYRYEQVDGRRVPMMRSVDTSRVACFRTPSTLIFLLPVVAILPLHPRKIVNDNQTDTESDNQSSGIQSSFRGLLSLLESLPACSIVFNFHTSNRLPGLRGAFSDIPSLLKKNSRGNCVLSHTTSQYQQSSSEILTF